MKDIRAFSLPVKTCAKLDELANHPTVLRLAPIPSKLKKPVEPIKPPDLPELDSMGLLQADYPTLYPLTKIPKTSWGVRGEDFRRLAFEYPGDAVAAKELKCRLQAYRLLNLPIFRAHLRYAHEARKYAVALRKYERAVEEASKKPNYSFAADYFITLGMKQFEESIADVHPEAGTRSDVGQSKNKPTKSTPRLTIASRSSRRRA